MIAKLTVKPLLITVALLVLVVATLSGTLLVKNARHGEAVAKLTRDRDVALRDKEAAVSAVEALTTTDARKMKTIEELVGKLDAAIDQTERLDELLAFAERELDATRNERDVALAKIRTQREQDYASDSTCGAWGAGAVCGRLTGSVLDQWNDAAGAGRRR